MSLTSVLSDRDNQDSRDRFKSDFLSPKLNLKTELKAIPLTNNSGIVGTAFDYLMRFYLQFHNKNKFEQRDNWVADYAYSSLVTRLNISSEENVRTGFYQDKVFKKAYLLKIISEQYNQTKINYSKYILDGKITENLVANTIFLAKLDLYVRTNIIDHTFDFHSNEDIKDIISLISLVDNRTFTAKEKCYFNPTFGSGSSLVGGADADFIIDNTLIDIKATKHLKLDRSYLNQILGYYILSLIGGVNDNPNDRPIENIGIYFARHGELWTVPVLQFGDAEKFENFKNWFISYFSKGNFSKENIQDSLLSLKEQQESNTQKTQKGFVKLYYIQTSSESIDSFNPLEITEQDALLKMKELSSEDDFIGFINEKKECIQFLKVEEDNWVIDNPIYDKKQNYLYSLADFALEDDEVYKIVSLFFRDETWEHICDLTQQ